MPAVVLHEVDVCCQGLLAAALQQPRVPGVGGGPGEGHHAGQADGAAAAVVQLVQPALRHQRVAALRREVHLEVC